MDKIDLRNISQPSKAFFERIVQSFPLANFQIIYGEIDHRKSPILRIASPSGDSLKNLDFYSSDTSGDVFEWMGCHFHVDDMHGASYNEAFAVFCKTIDEILKGKKGLNIKRTDIELNYHLVDRDEASTINSNIVFWD